MSPISEKPPDPAKVLYDNTPSTPTRQLHALEMNIRTELDEHFSRLGVRFRLSAADEAAERRRFCGAMRRMGVDTDAPLVLRYLSTYTDARMKEGLPAPEEPAAAAREQALAREQDYDELRKRHGADFEPLTDRAKRFAKADRDFEEFVTPGLSDLETLDSTLQHVRRAGWR